ncbi:hypothetical protein [Bdellovibrio bacteriovorus]|uniref:hypothetical protein n=1 Tax=Bdellovibrio bacteriovorus TaxID=959 RepID=UPI001D056705|nr:hypothetical protein [Bdellovibrio bacteriovorus]
MKLGSAFILLMISFWTSMVLAAPYRRLVNFEWEAIENAKSYEIELKQVKAKGEDAKTFTFKVTEAAWNGRLTPGKYMMKLRSRDYRGVRATIVAFPATGVNRANSTSDWKPPC